ncbi:MAG TPA: hypothetical protein PKZ41_04300 [Candidatus Omnitrophota bacterium]|nr:hypothetical protein [Candidatus Omnitrophota bacterium]
MRKLPAFVILALCLSSWAYPEAVHAQPLSSRPSAPVVDPSDPMDAVREKVADQIYLYREVMQHISDISESFSYGYNTPDEALKRVLVLRHAYNTKSEPLCPEIKRFNDLMNQMFSRLENYFIHFKQIYREDPYLNAKLAETKFYTAEEAERLEYTYLK